MFTTISHYNADCQPQNSYYQTIADKGKSFIFFGMKKTDKKEAIAKKHRAALRYWMETLDLNVSQWAKKAGIGEGTLRNFLSGNAESLQSDTLEYLAEAIGKNVGQMLNLEKEELISKDECIDMMGKCVSEIDEKIIEMSEMLHSTHK